MIRISCPMIILVAFLCSCLFVLIFLENGWPEIVRGFLSEVGLLPYKKYYYIWKYLEWYIIGSHLSSCDFIKSGFWGFFLVTLISWYPMVIYSSFTFRFRTVRAELDVKSDYSWLCILFSWTSTLLLFFPAAEGRTRSNMFKLKQNRSRLNIRQTSLLSKQ